MSSVNLYFSYAFLFKLCILLVFLSFLNCYPKCNLVFLRLKKELIIEPILTRFDTTKLYTQD